MHAGIPPPPPRKQTPPAEHTPPHGADIPPGADPPDQAPPSWEQTPPAAEHAGRYGQRAGGTHPTGMQSCI